MSFYKKYELDRLMADGEAKSFRAVELAGGRTVFLHLFNPSGQPLLAALQSKLGGAGGKTVAPLLEVGEFAGTPYAVTEAIEPFGNLRDWIAANVTGDVTGKVTGSVTGSVMAPNPLLDGDSAPSLALVDIPLAKPAAYADAGPLVPDPPAPARAPAAPPPMPVAPPPMPAAPPSRPVAPPPSLLSDGPGEFTRFFGSPEPAPPVSRTPAYDPGEFTRLFEGQRGAPPSPLPAPASTEPGEFTRMFEPFSPPSPSPPSPSLPPTTLPPTAPPTTAKEDPPDFPMPQASAPERPSLWPNPPQNNLPDTGQFTSLFGSALPGEAIDIEKEHASASRSASPGNRPFQEAGEFTRMFGPANPAGKGATPNQANLPPAPARNNLTSASGMFGDPENLARFASQTLSAGKPGQPQDSAPGEYTRFFDAPKKPEEPPKPAAPPAVLPEATVPKKSNKGPILIGIGAAVLVVLIVVAVVALLKH